MFDESRTTVFLGTDKVLKQILEDSLNLNLEKVEQTRDLASVIGDVSGRNLSIILTNNISASLRANYEQIIDILKELVSADNNTVVIELGLEGKVLPNNPKVFRFVDEVDLIKNKRREARGGTVRKAKEEGLNEYIIAYKEFEQEIEELKGKIEKENDKYERLDQEYKVLKRNYNSNDARATTLENEREGMEKRISELETLLEEKTMDAERYHMELEDLRERFSITEEERNSFMYDKKGLENLNRRRERENEGLKHEIKDLKITISELKESKEDLIHRVSGFDKYQGVEELIKKLEEENEVSRREKTELSIKYNQKVMQYEDLQDRLEDLKKDSTEIETIGRSLGMDNCKMKNVSVYYFKIINELPYFNTYLQTFIKLLNDKGDSGIIKTMIIRYDEGFDTEYFEGVNIYSNLSNASEGMDRTFRLFPSRKMFLGVEDFEDTVDTVVVLDYTKNRNYYVDTNGYSRRFVVVNNSKIKSKLNIEGNEISLGEKSKLDMTFDREISNARVSETKKRLVETKIYKWMKAMEILYE